MWVDTAPQRIHTQRSTGEIQANATSSPIKLTEIKNTDSAKNLWKWEKLDLLYIAGYTAKWHSHSGNVWRFLIKLSMHLSHSPTIARLGIYLTEIMYFHIKELSIAALFYSPKLETPKSFKWVIKCTVVQPDNRVRSISKEWTSNTTVWNGAKALCGVKIETPISKGNINRHLTYVTSQSDKMTVMTKKKMVLAAG